MTSHKIVVTKSDQGCLTSLIIKGGKNELILGKESGHGVSLVMFRKLIIKVLTCGTACCVLHLQLREACHFTRRERLSNQNTARKREHQRFQTSKWAIEHFCKCSSDERMNILGCILT